MRLIAHRGNTRGPKPMFENSLKYIDEALAEGFDAEVDLWISSGEPMLGHDEPQYKVDRRWFYDRFEKLWVHCKNFEALEWCMDSPFNSFAHDTDNNVLTKSGQIWMYPTMRTQSEYSVRVLPESSGEIDWESLLSMNYYAVCSDYVGYANVQRS